ncbi:MAG: hypothetical protein RIT45_641 [Pseudomonadota bacterium]
MKHEIARLFAAACALLAVGCLPEPRDAATLEAGYDNPNNAACSVSEQADLVSNTPKPFPSLENMFATCLVDRWNDCKTLQVCTTLCASSQGVGAGCSTCFGNLGTCLDKNCRGPCVLANPLVLTCATCIKANCSTPLKLCL